MGRLTKQLAADMKRVAAEKTKAALQPESLIALLRKQRYTTAKLCETTGGTEKQVMAAIGAVQGRGFLLTQFGDEWALHKSPAQQSERDRYTSRKDGTYLFGWSSDQHLGSKYERLDCLNALY